jgi:hypothetical protein
MPHNHRHVLGDWYVADAAHVRQAVAAAAQARREWANWPLEDRAAVFLKAAELLATTWRATLNAATMLGQSKTVMQAEIDAASELIDFWRFNPYFAQELCSEQPISSHSTWNSLDYRGLEGFVYAVTPFNFTSIAGNLPTAPALMGNTVIWKPASSAMLSAHSIVELLEAAGLPPGVINLVAGDAAEISAILLGSPDLAGVHFTGSTAVFNSMWTRVGEQIGRYRSYPRLVGETGGKDFILAHASADVQRNTTKADCQPPYAARLEPLMAEPRDDQRREQRHHGDEQTGGRAVQARLGVPQQNPRNADLDEREGEQPFPLAKRGQQGVAMQRHRQQQQRTQQGARARYHQRVDLEHGDANQQIGHAPEQAQGEKEGPAAF